MKTLIACTLAILSTALLGTAAPDANPPSAGAMSFPADYKAFENLGVGIGAQDPAIHTAFANDIAAGVKRTEQLPYPNGAVIVMEFANSIRDGEGQLLRNADGTPMKGAIVRLDVMRRGPGLGDKYGDSRAGDWEFASYRPDGTQALAPADATRCAACHQKAGAQADYVYRMKLPAKS